MVRSRTLDALAGSGQTPLSTAQVVAAAGQPETAVRRSLEELEAYGLVAREAGGFGKTDRWSETTWTTEIRSRAFRSVSETSG